MTDGADMIAAMDASDAGEALFRATFERAPVGIAHLTPAGRWLRVNDQLCAIVGYTREDLLARTFQDITHPDDLAADLAQVQRLLAGAIGRYSLEKRYIRADGRTVWINLTVTLVRDAAGAPRYFISVVEDISARKRAEEDLRRALGRAHALQAVADTALAHHDLDGLLAELLGRVREALAADLAVLLLPTPEGHDLVVRAAFGLEEEVAQGVRVPVGYGIAGTIAATRQPLIVEDVRAVEVISPYLRERARSLLGVPLLLGERVIGVLHVDTTAPRRFSADDLALLRVVAERVALAIDNAHLAEAQRRAYAAAAQAVELRDDVLAVATHDLRTPLTAMRGRAQLVQARLQQRATPDPAWIGAQLTHIAAATTRMLVTISQLDDVAHLQLGQPLALQCAALDLGALVRAITADTLSKAEAARVQLDAPTTPLCVHADRDRVGRIVQNLVSNALKYSPPQAPITVTVAAEATTATVTIQDRGVGIPADEIPRIFERFYRASTARGIRGTGLGLFGAKAIVEQHGGQLTLQSAVGQGTTVTVRLPRC